MCGIKVKLLSRLFFDFFFFKVRNEATKFFKQDGKNDEREVEEMEQRILEGGQEKPEARTHVPLLTGGGGRGVVKGWGVQEGRRRTRHISGGCWGPERTSPQQAGSVVWGAARVQLREGSLVDKETQRQGTASQATIVSVCMCASKSEYSRSALWCK